MKCLHLVSLPTEDDCFPDMSDACVCHVSVIRYTKDGF